MKFLKELPQIDWVSKTLGIQINYEFLTSWEVIIGMHLAYLIMVLYFHFTWPEDAPKKDDGAAAGESKDADKKKKKKVFTALDWIMAFYNLIQVIVSATQVYQLGKHLGYPPDVFDLYAPPTAHVELWIFFHYMTKYIDFFDTFFIGIKRAKRQFIFLHIYHHLTIGFIWGSLLNVGLANGTAYYGAWINSLIHTFMYFHYLVSAFGINNPFKAFLTQMQITQFFTCVLHAVLVLVMTDFPKNWATLQCCYHGTLIYLFTKFFRESQAEAKRLKAAEKKAKEVANEKPKEVEPAPVATTVVVPAADGNRTKSVGRTSSPAGKSKLDE